MVVARVPGEGRRSSRHRAGLWRQRVSVDGRFDLPCMVHLPGGRGERDDAACLRTRDNVCHASRTLLPAAADELLLLAKGCSQRGIAGKLDVSDNTVRTAPPARKIGRVCVLIRREPAGLHPRRTSLQVDGVRTLPLCTQPELKRKRAVFLAGAARMFGQKATSLGLAVVAR